MVSWERRGRETREKPHDRSDGASFAERIPKIRGEKESDCDRNEDRIGRFVVDEASTGENCRRNTKMKSHCGPEVTQWIPCTSRLLFCCRRVFSVALRPCTSLSGHAVKNEMIKKTWDESERKKIREKINREIKIDVIQWQVKDSIKQINIAMTLWLCPVFLGSRGCKTSFRTSNALERAKYSRTMKNIYIGREEI